MVHTNNNYNLDVILKSVKKKVEKQLDSLKKEIENTLDKLKEKIGKKEYNSYYYYFKNEGDILELEELIIHLINEDIDKNKFKSLNFIEKPNFEKSKENPNDSNNINSIEKSNTLIKGEKKISTIPKPTGKKIAQNSITGAHKFKGISENKTIHKRKQYAKRTIPESNIDKENNLNQIEQNFKSLDYFTSKDIQDENKYITRIFQKEALEYIDDEEEKENENIAYYLELIANDSRRAYNSSKKLFKKMFEEFSKTLNGKKAISTLKNDEQIKKEFSSWVKEYEKGPKGEQELKNYFKDERIFYKNEKISTLFPQLTKLYFHCKLSFPIVEIGFDDIKSGESFNHETMIDFINKGNNRKVNFVILPSLFSNGNFLENGKYWVFTYKKDTFNFSKLEFEKLIDKKEKYNLIYHKNILPNSQINKKNDNLLSKNTTNSKENNNSRGLSTNTNFTSNENQKKNYRYKRNQYNQKFLKK